MAYLWCGVMVLLLSQIIAKKFDKYDDTNALVWKYSLKISPDDDDFGSMIAGVILLWPFVLVVIAFVLVELAFRKIFTIIWKERDESDTEHLSESDR